MQMYLIYAYWRYDADMNIKGIPTLNVVPGQVTLG